MPKREELRERVKKELDDFLRINNHIQEPELEDFIGFVEMRLEEDE